MTEIVKRKIITINEEKCDGCGLCVPACHEGALQVIEGKAKLVSEVYCDGLGDCLGECPQGAIIITEREAAPFDPVAVEKRMSEIDNNKGSSCHEELHESGCINIPKDGFSPCCPPQEIRVSEKKGETGNENKDESEMQSELSNWPVQLHLVPPEASFLRNPDLLIAADCVPFACANFHRMILKDKSLLIGCPKLDDTAAYLEKLKEIFIKNDIKSVTVAIMEVPCCNGLLRLVEEAVKKSGKEIKLEKNIIKVDGSIS